MSDINKLDFSIFLIHILAEKWNVLPADVYAILNKSQVLDNYIFPCYDTLHTQGKNALVEDITNYVHEKGIAI